MNKNLSVLIVDDDAKICESLSDIVEASGYEVSTANSGEEALKLTRENEFDVILMDIRMPEMDGVETLKNIRKHTPAQQVAMMTAFAEDTLVEQSKIEGAICIFPKPLNIEKVLGFLKESSMLKTVFIIDDDKSFCSSLKDSLEIHGYKTIVFNDANEAIAGFSKQKDEIVLLDMKLNGINGLEVARKIKEKGHGGVVILMSAYSKEFQPLINETLKLKAKAFIEKPFELANLVKLIEAASHERLKEVLN